MAFQQITAAISAAMPFEKAADDEILDKDLQRPSNSKKGNMHAAMTHDCLAGTVKT